MQQPNKVRLGGRLKIGLHFSGLVEPLRSTRNDKKSLSKNILKRNGQRLLVYPALKRWAPDLVCSNFEISLSIVLA